MKNKEKYYEEIINSLTATNGHCNFKRKYVMELNYCPYGCKECNEIAKQWLESEYVEPIRLKKNEKVILENVDKDWEWIVRDENGDLWLHLDKPYKTERKNAEQFSYWDNKPETWLELSCFNHLFEFIKWEDEEPRLIEDLLKCEVVENVD